MKRLNSSDSFGALISICPTSTDEHSPRNNHHVYGRELQSMLDGLDEEGCIEESVHAVSEKKRRLSVNQVKALEKNFEVENKLEPERKVKLAQELGLQPRQVAVWFQNRRARWKTKQLERDYGVLKGNYESLEHNYDVLRHDNEALRKQIRELKAKLNEDNTESNVSVKEELILPETDHKVGVDLPIIGSIAASETKELLDYESCFNYKHSNSGWKEGLSDSDSSAILNDDNSPNPAISSSGAPGHHNLVTSPPPSTSLKFNSSTSSSSPSSASVSCIQFPEATPYQIQFVKTEEHNFFCSEEEACNFFSDQQAPTLQW